MSSLVEKVIKGVFTPATESKLIEILTSPQDGGKPSPVEILGQNAIGLCFTSPEAQTLCGALVGGGALF
jgi:hypothetical protein